MARDIAYVSVVMFGPKTISSATAVEESGHSSTRIREHGIGVAAGRVGSAGVRIVTAQVVGDGVDHALRNLRSSGPVEKRGRMSLTLCASAGN